MTSHIQPFKGFAAAVAFGLVAAAVAPAQIATSPVDDLDPDGNGLYDDAERHAMLQVLRDHCPELDEPFDHDGDGRVTVLEQTQGQDPLSVRIDAPALLAKNVEIPWAIDLFPEWITTALFQEDVAQANALGEHQARGNHASVAKAGSAQARPSVRTPGGGVEFGANSGQHLTLPGEFEAHMDYRWVAFTFRIDGDTGSADETILLDVNRGSASNRSSPKVWYSKETGLNVQYVGEGVDGLDVRHMATQEVVADGEAWNVLVCGIRWGQMYAVVNGVELETGQPQPQRFAGERFETATTYVGGGEGNAAWAYDALVFGITEPSEAMVRKLTGWAAHRLDFAGRLPTDHPYHAERPTLDAEDFPYRYRHDDEAWTAWGESLKSPSKLDNAGGPRVEPEGFERVFYDDFRAYRIANSRSNEEGVWGGPGFNVSVGVDAPLIAPNTSPDAYPYDAENQEQILSLVQEPNGRWRGSAFYTINDMGHGYTWAGPKVFRIRCKFPAVPQDELAGGLFPAFWSYDPDFLFWRTSNRIENDWWEFDGQNGSYLNGIASHIHYSQWRNNIFAKNPERYKSYKAYGADLSREKAKIPGELYFWDGQYHTWEYVVDRDFTYINITLPGPDGEDQWIELCRVPTPASYLERQDLQLDYALKAEHGKPNDGERQDFIVDFVEVLQKTEQLDHLPEVFKDRPVLTGGNAAGETVTCDAKLDGIDDVRYFWFADGYPLTWGVDNNLVITEKDAGKAIRCMVKAVGALDKPEAWSAPLQ